MYRTSQTDFVPPLVPASMTGGGKGKPVKPLRGGGRLGVSYLPERPVGGMLGRMPYGPQCIPVFHSSQLLYNGIAQGGGGSGSGSAKEDCGCESKERHDEWLYKLIEKPNPTAKKGMQKGGALITQFSAVSYVNQNLFAKMMIPQLIPIIVLAFAHSYILQYGNQKRGSSKKGFTLQGGGKNAFDREAKMRDFAQILQPLGTTNLRTLASILTMHYFAARHLKEKVPQPILQEGVHKTEMRMKEALGDHKTFQELEKVFLSKSSKNLNLEGGGKGKGEAKIRSLIKPIGKTRFLANGVMIKLKKLFQNYHHVAHDESKEKMQSYQKKTEKAFKDLFDTLSPISVGMKIAAEKK